MDYTILVNKQNAVNEKDWNPELVPAKTTYREDTIFLEKKTYEHWTALKKDTLKAKGYQIELQSCYRSFDYQKKVLEELIAKKGEEYASKAVALPGYSEHQTGLALDYCLFKDNRFFEDHDLDNSKEANYIASIAHNYGFIIRYPKGKEDITGYQSEPWHLRYVGKSLARYLYENKLTLDEYYLKKKEGM